MRVMVMLTAESEGGQVKCHPYWLPGDYGTFKIKALSERKVSLDYKDKPSRSYTSPIRPPNKQEAARPGMARRHSSKPGFFQSQPESSERDDSRLSASSAHTPGDGSPSDPDKPHVIIRKLALVHASEPFAPLREITQVQYSSWPDFGAPARPADVLGLVDVCDSIIHPVSGTHRSSPTMEGIAQGGTHPIVVHCSAGCGRTGTFCTIDTVLDMLKRQRDWRRRNRDADSSTPPLLDQDAWMKDDSQDLVAATVANFRLQRLSMVQTLRQFVLCYESVLEWAVSER